MKRLMLAAALLAAAGVEAQNARPGGAGRMVNGPAAQPAANFTPLANYFPPPVVYRVMVAPLANQTTPTATASQRLRVQAAPVATNGAGSGIIIARARP